MTVYFDKANLEVFAGRKSEAMYPDCLRMVQRDLDKTFNFSKDELKANANLLAWFQLHMAGNIGKTTITYADPVFPVRPLKSNTPNTFNATQLASVYLLDDERMDAFKGTSAVLAGKPGECIETLTPLFLGNGDYKFERKYRISDKANVGATTPPATFCEWAQLKEVATPITDILIVDRFIAHDVSLLPANLEALIAGLGCHSRTAVNVVIYTDSSKLKADYTALRARVRAAIQRATGKQGTFTLVSVTTIKGLKSFGEHDRTILTNYFRVYSGDSFNYWLSNGTKTTTGREISFSSLADETNRLLAKQLVADLQANLDQLSDRSIEGDKKSGFFTFK
ncbi:MAG: hypothetical protein IPM49_00725 [Flavobacteriales bacterium]|nr:hypothetical protein [Flavobacteriales bacterium]